MPEKKPRKLASKKLSKAGQQPGVKRGRRRQKQRTTGPDCAELGAVPVIVDDRHPGNQTEAEGPMADAASPAEVAPADHVPPQPHQSVEDQRPPSDPHPPDQEHRDIAVGYLEPGAVTDDVNDRYHAERQVASVAPAADVTPQEHQRAEGQHPPQPDGEQLGDHQRRVRERRFVESGLASRRARDHGFRRFFKGEWREIKAGWARLVVVGLIFLCFGYWIRGMQSTQEHHGATQTKLEAKPSLPSGNEETMENQIGFPSGETAHSTNGGKPGVMEGNAAVNEESAPPAEGPEVVEMRNSPITNPPRGNPLLQSNALMQEYFIHQRAWLQLPEHERAARQKAFNELEARIKAASSDSERNALMNELHKLP